MRAAMTAPSALLLMSLPPSAPPPMPLTRRQLPPSSAPAARGGGDSLVAAGSTAVVFGAPHALARAQEALEQHGGDDDRPDRGPLPIGIDVEEIEAVADEDHDQNADEGADDRAPSAEEARPANHHAGDRVELEPVPRDRVDRENAGGEEN